MVPIEESPRPEAGEEGQNPFRLQPCRAHLLSGDGESATGSEDVDEAREPVMRAREPEERQRFPADLMFDGGQGRGRTADLRFFRPALYQLSYLTGAAAEDEPRLAGTTGFEPATSGLTGRRELQTSPRDLEIMYFAPPTGFEPVLPP